MQQAVQNAPSPLERNLTVSVPMAAIEAEVVTRLKKLARTVKMQGFRPGKVPLKMVERHYGYQVRQEVVSDSVHQSFADAVKSHEYRVAGFPRFQPVQAPQGEGSVEFTATFEVYPEIAMADLAGAAVKRPVTPVGPENIATTLETLRRQRAPFEPVPRAAATGDLVNLDFEGLIEGAAFEGNAASNFTVVLGEGRMLPDFEAAVVGAKAGDAREFPVRFPDEYAAEVRGKTAQFKVVVNHVAEARLPALDGEFAKALGVENGDVERLKSEVRENIQKEVDKRIKARVKEQVMDALLAAATFELPRALVDAEIQRMQASAVEDLKSRGMTTENLSLPPELFAERATRRVKLGLLVADLVKKEGLMARPEQVRKAVEAHADSFEQPDQLVRWFYSDPNRLADVEALVMEDNVVEWALAKVKVSDEPMAFDELMGTRKAA